MINIKDYLEAKDKMSLLILKRIRELEEEKLEHEEQLRRTANGSVAEGILYRKLSTVKTLIEINFDILSKIKQTINEPKAMQ